MKGKKFYLILIGLIAVGIGSIFVYRQQEEARVLEFEGYEILSIEARVEELYNEDKTDIQEDISSELVDLEQIFLELSKKNLSYRSENHIQYLRDDFLNAKEMHELQVDILTLFAKDDIVRKNTSKATLEELEASLIPFEDKIVYFNRNNDYITDARVQLETIEEATELVESLAEDGIPREDLELEDLDKAEELIKQIKDKDLQESLLGKIEAARLVLAESEEAIVLEDMEDSEVVEELEEDLEESIIEESVEEELIEEESMETVQDPAQRNEQSNTPTTPHNNRTNNTQQRASNNTQSNSTQKTIPNNNRSNNTQQQNSKNNQTSSTQSDKETSSQSNNESSTQTQKPSNANENKPDPNRNSVAEKYRETKTVEEYPYTTREKTDSSVAAGTIIEPGRTGSKTVTYEVTNYTNGTSSRKFISEDITLPKDEVVAVGGASQEPPAAE